MRSGIHEGSEDEFGDMEAAGGSGDGRVASPLLTRALDDSLQATQDILQGDGHGEGQGVSVSPG